MISKDNIIVGGRSFKDRQDLSIDVDEKIRGIVEGDKNSKNSWDYTLEKFKERRSK